MQQGPRRNIGATARNRNKSPANFNKRLEKFLQNYNPTVNDDQVRFINSHRLSFSKNDHNTNSFGFSPNIIWDHKK